MQVLKDEVKKSIRDAAIKAFKEKGYRDASMREIASGAGMSVGNLYRYFKNKETLFAYLVQPLVEMFIKGSETEERKFNEDLLDVNFLQNSKMMEMLINSRAIYREELFILFLRAEGSLFEGARAEFVKFIESKMKKLMNIKSDDSEIIKGRLFSQYTASSMVESFCIVLEGADTDEEFIYNLIELGEYIVKPAIRNLIAIKNNEIKSRRISDEEVHRYFSSHSAACGNSNT